MRVDFGPWTPDQPALNNPGCIQAKNVVPLAGSFGPFNNLSVQTTALTEACLGAFWLPDLSGNAVNFAGDQSKLYKYAEGTATWTNVSRTASYAAAVSWNFEKFGGRCVAVDIANPPQYYDLASSSVFQDLPGSPPQAKYIAAIRDFLVMGNISGAPNRVRWSGFNNSELWTASLSTQSDSQDLPGRGGDVQGIVPGEYGVVFQENSIWRMDYVGPSVVFQFDEVERGRGTPAPRSVTFIGQDIFYYDNSGFYYFNGVQSTPIGRNVVDQWFNDNTADVSSLIGVIDRVNRRVMWGFKSTANPSYNDRILMYSLETGGWAWAAVNTEFLYERLSGQVDLDTLGTILTGGIDAQSIPMDSPFFSAQLSVNAFDWAHKSGSFDGDPLDAIVESRELAADESTSRVNSVRPLVEGGSVTAQICHRPNQQTDCTYTNAAATNRIGECNIRLDSRYQRVRLNVSGNFTHIQGAEIRGRRSGRR